MLSECRHKSVRLRRFGINAQIGNYSRKQHVLNSGSEGRYAFDADTSPWTTLWHANLLDSAHGGTTRETTVPSGATGGLVGNGFGDITPEVEVTGTPVIDPVTNTIYVVSKSVNGSTQFPAVACPGLDHRKREGHASERGRLHCGCRNRRRIGEGASDIDPRNEH
jgi:hypothetical protein